MRSQRPKPIHLVCGRPMVVHVLTALTGLAIDRTVVVVGHGAERVTKKVQEEGLGDLHVTFVEQRVQRGTGDAVMVGLTAFHDDDVDDDATVVVLPGDTPAAAARHGRARSWPCTRPRTTPPRCCRPAWPSPPATAGSSAGADGRVARIVEQRDATSEERAIDEVNTSIYCFRRDLLGPALRRLSPDNAQGEYYLTDVIGVPGLGRLPGRRRSAVERPGRDAGRQRPRPAGRRRGRAPRPHEPALAAERRHHARPGADVHRRHRRARPRRHPLPGHASCRAAPSSAPVARSGPTPA